MAVSIDSDTHGSCTRMPAIRLAISRGAFTRTSCARSANFGLRTLTTGRSQDRSFGVENGHRLPGDAAAENS